MREILFKAKRINDNEWVEGYFIDNEIACGTWEGCTGIDSYAIDPETLCQFTGIYDKNGKKIWENDIIKYHFGEIYAPIKYGYYQNCFDSQKTEHLGFYVDWTGDKCLRKDLGYWIDMEITVTVWKPLFIARSRENVYLIKKQKPFLTGAR